MYSLFYGLQGDISTFIKCMCTGVAKARIRVHAVVRSRHDLSQIGIDSIHSCIDKNVSREHFDGREDAKNWLKGLQPVLCLRRCPLS